MEKLSINGLETVLEDLTSQQQALSRMVDWIKGLQVVVEIPGMTAEDIELSLEGNRLNLALTGKRSKIAQETDIVVIGNSPQIRTVAGVAEQMANRNEHVVLQGETGTGKEHFARYIHFSGKRGKNPFVRMAASSLSDSGQLGAALDEVGEGTLYLTDIDELDAAAQKDLIGCLAGDNRVLACRIMAATRKDLNQLVAAGQFSAALKEWLGQCYIPLPSLRDRREDIIPLARYYFPILSRKISHTSKVMTPEYLHVLELYDWPGNVRELINTLEQSLYSAGDKSTLFNKDLPTYIRIETVKKVAQQKQGI